MRNGSKTDPYFENKILRSGLLGISVAGVLSILNVCFIDLCLKLSIYGFSVSIPALSGSLLIDYIKQKQDIKPTWYGSWMVFFGIIGSIGGIICIFFHLVFYAGIEFTISMIIAFIIVSIYWGKIAKKN